MRRVPVSGTSLFALVDDEDWDKVKEWTWCLNKDGYVVATVFRQHTSIHRLVMGHGPGDPDLHHKDQNKLNNQKYNLIQCSDSQNNAMRGKPKNNTSGYKGVVWRKDRQKWWARVMKDKKWHCAGTFTDIEQAARAYDKLAKLLFGDFACLNFPEK